MMPYFNLRVYKNTVDLRNSLATMYSNNQILSDFDYIGKYMDINIDDSLKVINQNIELLVNKSTEITTLLDRLKTPDWRTWIKIQKFYQYIFTGPHFEDIYKQTRNIYVYYIRQLGEIRNKINDNESFLTELNDLIKTIKDNQSLGDQWYKLVNNDFYLVNEELYNSLNSLLSAISQFNFYRNLESSEYLDIPINDFVIDRDLGSIIHNITINNVIITDETKNIGRYDTIIVTYKFGPTDSITLFRGFIEDFSFDFGLDGEYMSIVCLSNLSILNRTPLPYGSTSTDLVSWLRDVVQITQSGIFLERFYFNTFNIKDIADVNNEGNIKDKIDHIRENYPVYITESHYGGMRLISPYYLFEKTEAVVNNSIYANLEDAIASIEEEFINVSTTYIEKKEFPDPKKVTTLIQIGQPKEKYVLNSITRGNLELILKNFLTIGESPYRAITPKQLQESIDDFSNIVYNKASSSNQNIEATDKDIFGALRKTIYTMVQFREWLIDYNRQQKDIYSLGISKKSAITESLNDFSDSRELRVWDLDYKADINKLNIKGNAGNVNAVFVLGMGSLPQYQQQSDINAESDITFGFGVALDTYEILINNKQVVPLIIRRYDIADQVTLDQEAGKLLLENKNNYSATCRLNDFVPSVNVGDYVIIKNVPVIPSSSNEKIYDGTIFIVEKLNHVVNNQELTTTLTLKANHLESVPQKILIGDGAKSAGLLSKNFIFNYLGDLKSV